MRQNTLGLLLFFATACSIATGQEKELTPKKVSLGEGVTLHYVERGKGEPILFIHGLTSDYTSWTPHLEAFAKEGYRAIAYSRRYNYPNENTLRPDHSIADEATDLVGLIRKLGLKKPHIVGHSRGAFTALFMALQHPDLVASLTLGEPPLVAWLRNLPGDQRERGLEQFRRIIQLGGDPARAALAAGDEELALRTMINAISGDGKFAKLPDRIKSRCRRNLKELRALLTSREHPRVTREQVARLTVPTLILSGSKSVATASLTDAELERSLPKKSRKRIVFQGATHAMWSEQPDRCRKAVLSFIRKKKEETPSKE